MAFSYVLTNAAVTNTDPAGTDLISLGDDNIRTFKSAVIERVNSRFVDVNADPWIMKSPVSGGNVQSVVPNADNLYTLGTAALRFAQIWGTLSTAAQPNITSLGTLTSLIVSGAISSGVNPASVGQIRIPNASDIYGRNAANSADRHIIGTTVANGIRIDLDGGGTTFGAGITATTLTGTIATAAQPNITSLGIITSLVGAGTLAIQSVGETTGHQYWQIANTGGTFLWGVDRSVGGALVTGSGAYSAVI